MKRQPTSPESNVVPIDAATALSFARRGRALRLYVMTLAIVWVGALVAVCTLSPLPPLVPLAVLSALVVLTEHRHVLFGDETSMSGSLIIILASLLIFRDSAPFTGPFIVASLAGAYWPHIRDRRLELIAANVTSTGLSALAALSITLMMNPIDSLGMRTAVLASSVLAYWTLNSITIGVVASLRNGTTALGAIRDQLRSNPELIPLAVAGALSGSEIHARQIVSGTLMLLGAVVSADILLNTWQRVWHIVRRKTFFFATIKPISVLGAALIAWTFSGSPLPIYVLYAAGLLMAFVLALHSGHGQPRLGVECAPIFTLIGIGAIGNRTAPDVFTLAFAIFTASALLCLMWRVRRAEAWLIVSMGAGCMTTLLLSDLSDRMPVQQVIVILTAVLLLVIPNAPVLRAAVTGWRDRVRILFITSVPSRKELVHVAFVIVIAMGWFRNLQPAVTLMLLAAITSYHEWTLSRYASARATKSLVLADALALDFWEDVEGRPSSCI